MTDQTEQRLAAAGAAARRLEMTARRRDELAARRDELMPRRDELRAALAGEQRDVERLEGRSLTRVLVAMRGSRDEALARERAEADAARYRLEETQGLLDAVQRELDAAQSLLADLAGAPGAYAAALADRERELSQSGDPRGRQLIGLAAERGRLTAELQELAEAQRAAQAAAQALAEVEGQLSSASGWSTYDTFFGGGMLASAIKHDKLDQAAQAAAHADQLLAVLRTELADVAELTPTAPQLPLDGLTRFADIWFDNIFTDFAVRNQIMQAQDRVAQAAQMVADIRHRLAAGADQATARLAAIEAERRALLTPG
jgi:DNA repair exonuclease SbcCD ATPase subunit